MNGFDGFGVKALGGVWVLSAGLLISKSMGLGLEKVFGACLLIFVFGGAIALVMKSGA